MYEPLVSIIIPVYKGKPFLKEAIDSCLEQTYSNIEIIVVNDGSPDYGETEKIATSYGDKVRYFYKENGGVSTALNYGIKKMRGEWFSWLSHDDLYEPDKIKRQIQAVAKLKNKVCVVRCTTCSINEVGEPIFRPQRKISGYFSAIEMMKLHSLQEVGLYGCTLLIHKSILENCGDFDVKLRATQDEDYWNRIMFFGYPFLSLPDVLVKIRVHQGQTTNLLAQRFAPEHRILMEKAIQYFRYNIKLNLPLIEILMYKQAKERRKEENLLVKNAIQESVGSNLKRNLDNSLYLLYGHFYSLAKTIYRNIIVKRIRKS